MAIRMHSASVTGGPETASAVVGISAGAGGGWAAAKPTPKRRITPVVSPPRRAARLRQCREGLLIGGSASLLSSTYPSRRSPRFRHVCCSVFLASAIDFAFLYAQPGSPKNYE